MPWGRIGRYALLGALLLVILYPAAILVYLAFWSSPPGTPGVPTLQRFHDAFTAPGFGRSVVNTAIFAVTKAALAAVIGGGLAFLVARTDLPARRTVTALVAAPFFVPSLLTALAWSIIANPKTGMLNEWLMHLGLSGPLLNVYTIQGMIFQATPITAAMFFLLTLGAFKSLNPEMEEAAQICGASRLTMIRTVVIPIMAPALTGAAILSLIRGMEAFETPYFLGSPGGIFVLSTEIYRYLVLDTPPEPGNAGAISMSILAVTLFVMLLQWKVLGRKSYATESGRAGSGKVHRLGRWHRPIFACVILYVVLALGVPLVFLVAGSFTSVFGVFSAAYLAEQLVGRAPERPALARVFRDLAGSDRFRRHRRAGLRHHRLHTHPLEVVGRQSHGCADLDPVGDAGPRTRPRLPVGCDPHADRNKHLRHAATARYRVRRHVAAGRCPRHVRQHQPNRTATRRGGPRLRC